MKMKSISSLTQFNWILGFINVAIASEWSYEGHRSTGPSHWKDMEGNEACGGERQSPIDIATSEAVTNERLGTFTFTGYDTKPDSMLVKNNGHTAQVNLEGDIKISGGGLDGEYKTAQFHFHWGSVNSQGSEHFIDGKQYPMEIHMVHYSSQYSTFLEAASQPDGLAALSFMVEIAEGNNTALNDLLLGLRRISYKDTSVQLEPFSLDNFLPEDRAHFYRYQGSLTTPHCQETVTWTIFNSKIQISQSQLDEFRQLRTNEVGNTQHEGEISDNFRPVQAINGRTIYTSSSNKAVPTYSMILMFVSLLTVYTSDGK